MENREDKFEYAGVLEGHKVYLCYTPGGPEKEEITVLWEEAKQNDSFLKMLKAAGMVQKENHD